MRLSQSHPAIQEFRYINTIEKEFHERTQNIHMNNMHKFEEKIVIIFRQRKTLVANTNLLTTYCKSNSLINISRITVLQIHGRETPET